MRVLVLALALLLGGAPGQALAAQGQSGKNFDHTATGFPLTGQHETVRCEDCHVRGIFKGTSPVCASCHTQGSMVTAVFFPANHFPTGPLPSGATAGTAAVSNATSDLLGQPCDSCHTTNSFFGAHFVHDNVTPGTCNACHNGIFAMGKTANHIPVGNLSCDQCHSTVSFATGFLSTPASHIPIVAAANCSSCHDKIAAGSFASVVLPMPHDGLVTGTCISCHRTAQLFAGSVFTPNSGSGGGGTFGTQLGINFAPKQIIPVNVSGGHVPIPVPDDCNTCHVGKAYSAFGPNTAMVHANVTGNCSSCHSVGMTWYGVGNLVTPAANHLPPANASGVAKVDCASCHSNTSFATGGFKITTTPVMSVAAHTAVAAAVPVCATCHEASSADLGYQGVSASIYLRPDTAVSGLSAGLGLDPYHGTGAAATQDCGVCHKSTAPPFTANLGVPTGHIPLNSSSVSCADCHANGYLPGATIMKHADVTTVSCATCHNTSTTFLGTSQGSGGQPWQMSGAVASSGTGSTTHFPPGSGGCNGSGCHAVSDTLTANGAGFFITATNPVLSAAGHATVSESCETCHAVGSSWKGVATLVTPLANHIPPDNVAGSTVGCASCHSSSSFGSGGFKLGGTPGGPGAVMTQAMHAAVATAVPLCETCHEASAADLGFQGIAASIYLRPNNGANSGLSQPTDALHTGAAATQDCYSSNCHTSTVGPFVGMPNGHIAVAAGVTCATCHTNSASGIYYNVVLPMPHAGTVSGTCASCHNTATKFAGSVFTPASGSGGGGTFGTQTSGLNFQPKQIIASPAVGAAGGHVPLPTGDDCSVCHTSTTYSSFGPNTAMVHTNISSGCNSCHNLGQSWYGVSKLVTPTAQHIPPANTTAQASVDCSSCHYTAGETFATGGFHLTGTPGGAGAVMTSAMHTAVATAVPACETCHEANAADLAFQGIAKSIYLRPNNGANSGLSLATDALHTGLAATADCGSSGCHTSTTGPFLGYPTGHIAIAAGAACTTCHTNANSGVYSNVVLPMPHAGAVSGTCASCHNTSTFFAGSTFTPAGGSGGGGTFGTQTSGLNFQPKQIIASPAVGTAGGHVPLPSGDDCSVCHTSTAYSSFGPNTAMVHTNISSGCNSCHNLGQSWYGVSNLVTPTAAHIPPANTTAQASVDCSSCHYTSGETFASGGFHLTGTPGTAGAVMTPAMHTAVATAVSACETCHEASAANLTYQGITTSIYLRPNNGANSGLSQATDTAHVGNAATLDCGSSGCHGTTGPFQGFPTGHIPVVSGATCATCHTTNTTSVVLPMPHTQVSGTCASCHDTATVFAGSVFTPAASGGGGTFGTQTGTNFRPKQIITTPAIGAAGGHIPLPSGDDCSVCHTSAATANYTYFGPNTAMVHTNISSGCNSCHNLGQSWYGVSNLVTPTAAHIPPANTTAQASVDCSSCHYTSGETFASGGFHLTGTPGTAGAVMTPAMHTAVATAVPACETCHEASAANLTYQGITTNIYLRPNNGANSGLSQATDTAHVGNAATLDCGSSGCHGTTGPFQGFPTGHIPVVSGANCATCHTTNQTSVVLPMPHSGLVSGTCGSCHNTTTKFAGSVFTPNASGGGGTFGTQTGLNFQPKQIIASPAIGSSGGHIPLPSGDDCSTCHTSTTYSAFGPGTAMVHTNITSGCATCHYNNAVWYGVAATASMLQTTGGKVLSPLHVPVAGATNAACEECHSTTVFTSFGTSTKVNHTSGQFMTWTGYTTRGALDGQGGGSAAPTCTSCHAPGGKTWYGVSLSTETMGSHQGSSAANDCENCHNSTSKFDNAAAAAAAVRRRLSMGHSAGPALRAPGTGGTGTSGGGIGGTGGPVAKPSQLDMTAFTHVGVAPGSCAGCHAAGGTATAKPGNHLPTLLSCDSCHRTSSWLPAIFLHNGVAAGTCATCHTGSWATAKPANHMVTLRSCDTCHQGTSSWTQVSYPHFDLVYTPHPPSVSCAACHTTNTEQVTWKFANLKPGCGGCHGPTFQGTRASEQRNRVFVPRR